MKKGFCLLIVCSFVLIGFLVSCVSLTDKTISRDQLSDIEVLGQVKSTFSTFHFLHIIPSKSIKNKAYLKLLLEAKQEYPGLNNIDVVNIVIEGYGNVLWYSLFEFTLPFWPIMNVQQIMATGDVVNYNTEARKIQTLQKSIVGPLAKVTETLIDELPQTVIVDGRSKDALIAVLSVASSDSGMASLVVDELEYQLVKAKRAVVSRRDMDTIRRQQDLQLDADIDEDSAVALGHLSGWNVVILGNISDSGSMKRLTLRVLNAQTNRLITIVREDF
jgi:hypothetical protein